MSTLISASIKASELKKINAKKIIKGEKDSYIPITISVNDESRFGKNVAIFVAQDENERKERTEKHYLGNGSVIWTDGTVKQGQKEDSVETSKSDNNGLNDMPF